MSGHVRIVVVLYHLQTVQWYPCSCFLIGDIHGGFMVVLLVPAMAFCIPRR